MKTPAINVGTEGQRVALRLLRNVRTAQGQEFLAGWVAGFDALTAEFLLASGAAVPFTPGTPLEVAAAALAEEPPPAQVVPVTVAPISTGEEAPPPVAPQPPTTSRRRK